MVKKKTSKTIINIKKKSFWCIRDSFSVQTQDQSIILVPLYKKKKNKIQCPSTRSCGSVQFYTILCFHSHETCSVLATDMNILNGHLIEGL